MIVLALSLVALPLVIGGYAYVGYPLLLRVVAAFRPPRRLPPAPAEWPLVTLTLPAYNEARVIRATLDNLLAIDYPAERLQLVVVSDCSSDGTDEIVREYASRGVELVRLPKRMGKTAAEHAATAAARGAIVVNTDASVRVPPGSLKPLVRAFGDPTVGVASGRDVSIGDVSAEGNGGESGYVGYEMTVRALETRVGSIVGASGCFFAFRRECADLSFPVHLSRDFASCLIARERGYRSVSVDEAVCVVPRTTSLQAEARRKARTMARGLATLLHKRHLMNPLRHGAFAWMLVSHKLCRWLVYPALPLAAAGLVLLGILWPPAAVAVAAAAAGVLLGVAGLRWPAGRAVPRPLALAGFLLASNWAGVQAWAKVARGETSPVWEPTRRPA